MTTYGYLRVSSDSQDVENQKLGVLDFCNSNNLAPVVIHKDIASGRLPWRERGIGILLSKMNTSDTLVVSEISRLARSTLQVLEILEAAAKQGICVYVVKSRMIMDGSLQATISATIFGLAAQIERDFISERTKEALARKKSEGIQLGRPKGPAEKVKLDNRRDEINFYFKKGISKRSVAKLLDCSPTTLYSWLKRGGNSTQKLAGALL
jgi:DNA invertase Pin-like site-specific DNA recombinase